MALEPALGHDGAFPFDPRLENGDVRTLEIVEGFGRAGQADSHRRAPGLQRQGKMLAGEPMPIELIAVRMKAPAKDGLGEPAGEPVDAGEAVRRKPYPAMVAGAGAV